MIASCNDGEVTAHLNGLHSAMLWPVVPAWSISVTNWVVVSLSEISVTIPRKYSSWPSTDGGNGSGRNKLPSIKPTVADTSNMPPHAAGLKKMSAIPAAAGIVAHIVDSPSCVAQIPIIKPIATGNSGRLERGGRNVGIILDYSFVSRLKAYRGKVFCKHVASAQ